MLKNGTVNKELASVLKTDSTGEAMRCYQRRMLAASEKFEGFSRGAINNTSTKAFKAASELLPVLWRDLNRR